jgi:hypothetical protein
MIVDIIPNTITAVKGSFVSGGNPDRIDTNGSEMVRSVFEKLPQAAVTAFGKICSKEPVKAL